MDNTLDKTIPDAAPIKLELKIYADEDTVIIDMFYKNGNAVRYELRQSKITIRNITAKNTIFILIICEVMFI